MARIISYPAIAVKAVWPVQWSEIQTTSGFQRLAKAAEFQYGAVEFIRPFQSAIQGDAISKLAACGEDRSGENADPFVHSGAK